MTSALSIPFDELVKWGSRDNYTAYRPYCMIKVHGNPAPSCRDLWGILDTGADHVMLPRGIACELNIDIVNCPRECVAVASGHTICLPRTHVDVTIRGKRISVVATFGVNKTPLIGLHAIRKAMAFGIEWDGWLYRRR